MVGNYFQQSFRDFMNFNFIYYTLNSNGMTFFWGIMPERKSVYITETTQHFSDANTHKLPSQSHITQIVINQNTKTNGIVGHFFH
jgi:hypothetical protein